MFRRSCTVLLLLVMQWQMLLTFTPVSISEQASALGHALVHVEGVGHHHHDDHSFQVEDDHGTPTQHVHHDVSHHTACLLPAAAVGLAHIRSTSPPTGVDDVQPSPYIEGPLRPPRHSA